MALSFWLVVILGSVILLQTLAFVFYLWYTGREHQAERRDLYTRIMAKDLMDYEAAAQIAPVKRSNNFVFEGLRRGDRERMAEAYNLDPE